MFSLQSNPSFTVCTWFLLSPGTFSQRFTTKFVNHFPVAFVMLTTISLSYSVSRSLTIQISCSLTPGLAVIGPNLLWCELLYSQTLNSSVSLFSSKVKLSHFSCFFLLHEYYSAGFLHPPYYSLETLTVSSPSLTVPRINWSIPGAAACSRTRWIQELMQRFSILLSAWTLASLYRKMHICGDVQFSYSVVWLCDPRDWSMLGFPVHHRLPELAQTHIHRVGDAV